MPIEPEWLKLEPLFQRYMAAHPEWAEEAFDNSKRLWVFHRGVGVASFRGTLFLQKLDALLFRMFGRCCGKRTKAEEAVASAPAAVAVVAAEKPAVTVVQADAQGVEQVCGILQGVFGTGRTSQIASRRPVQPPVPVSAEAAEPLPYLPGLTPNFTQHLDFRLAEGAFPFTGGGDWLTRYHLRLKDSDGVDTELIAIMLTDAGPTPALSQAKTFAPASSVSWALELRPVANVDPAGLWRLDQDTIAYDEGYANDRAHLWTPDGQLAAFGYQVVAVYA